APAEQLDVELANIEVAAIQVSNFQLTAPGRLQLPCPVRHCAVIEVEARDGVVRLGLRWFLFEPDDHPGSVELRNAVRAGVLHPVSEDRRACLPFCGGGDELLKPVTVKYIVAEDERRARAGEEVPAQDERLRNAVRLRLRDVVECDPPLA